MKNDPLQKIFSNIDAVKDLSDADLEALVPTAQLLERLHGAVDRQPGARWRERVLRRSVVISVTAVLVLAGTAAALTFLRAPVQNTTRLSCFAKVSLSSDADVIAYTPHALLSCQSLMSWPPMPASPNPKGSLCVLSDGSLAGFPPSRQSHVCADLGLAAFNGRLADAKVAVFVEVAQSFFTKHPCLETAVARKEVHQLLKKYDVSGWRVEVSGSNAKNACATLSIQISHRLVEIVGFGSS